MKVTQLNEEMVKIQPDEGKKLIYALDNKEHSEAIVSEKEVQFFHEEDSE